MYRVAFMMVLGLWGGCCAANNTLRPLTLKPRMRAEPLETVKQQPIQETLQAFLLENLVLDQKQFEKSPQILAFEQAQTLGAPGDRFYVEHLPERLVGSLYTIYQAKGQRYQHPITREKLGFQAEVVATARLEHWGKRSILRIIKIRDATVERGMRVIAQEDSRALASIFTPKAADIQKTGHILAVQDGSTAIGTYRVVTLSLGMREGLKIGDQVGIYHIPEDILAQNKKRSFFGRITKPEPVPDVRVGQAMIFKVYEKLSLALITQATDRIYLQDIIKNP